MQCKARSPAMSPSCFVVSDVKLWFKHYACCCCRKSDSKWPLDWLLTLNALPSFTTHPHSCSTHTQSKAHCNYQTQTCVQMAASPHGDSLLKTTPWCPSLSQAKSADCPRSQDGCRADINNGSTAQQVMHVSRSMSSVLKLVL